MQNKMVLIIRKRNIRVQHIFIVDQKNVLSGYSMENTVLGPGDAKMKNFGEK